MTAGPLLALLAVQFFFGTWPVVGKVGLRHLDPFLFAWLRVSFAGLLLVALYWGRRHGWWLQRRGGARVTGQDSLPNPLPWPHPPRSDLWRLFGLAVLGVLLNQVFFLTGLARTDPVSASVLVTTIPVWTLLVAIVLGREQPGPRRILGILLAFTGVLVLMGAGSGVATFGGSKAMGDLFVTLNAFFFGAYLVLARDIMQRHDPLTVATWTMLFGTLLITAFWLVAESVQGTLTNAPERLGWGAATGPPTIAWVAVGYAAVFVTVAPYLLNNYALKRVASTTVATFIYLQPIVAATLDHFVIGTQLGPEDFLGSALILTGVWFAAVRRRPRHVLEVTKAP